MCENPDSVASVLKSLEAPPRQDDVAQRDACAARAAASPKATERADEAPPKKRKTRRGKTKRRCLQQPYDKNDRKSTKMNKAAKAPYNSNQFLLEDHVTRTRDSSFSVDSDAEFYSSPDDEEEFLIKDFDDQYERLHAERLHSMSKAELIQEYLLLEGRVEALTKHLRSKINGREQQPELQREVERLTIENETLRRENSDLRSKISASASSDSEDSETDSSDSCSSSTSSMSRPESPVAADYAQTNGHSPPNLQAV